MEMIPLWKLARAHRREPYLGTEPSGASGTHAGAGGAFGFLRMVMPAKLPARYTIHAASSHIAGFEMPPVFVKKNPAMTVKPKPSPANCTSLDGSLIRTSNNGNRC